MTIRINHNNDLADKSFALRQLLKVVRVGKNCQMFIIIETFPRLEVIARYGAPSQYGPLRSERSFGDARSGVDIEISKQY